MRFTHDEMRVAVVTPDYGRSETIHVVIRRRCCNYEKDVSYLSPLLLLQTACDLLRKVIRMLFLLKRLKSQMQGGNKEITKMAQTFSELGL